VFIELGKSKEAKLVFPADLAVARQSSTATGSNKSRKVVSQLLIVSFITTPFAEVVLAPSAYWLDLFNDRNLNPA